jgi:hypothetical protein
MTAQKQIFLHIGHGKTGTSAFQAYLAIAKSSIAKNGYYYHAHPSMKDAQNLKTTAGNIIANRPNTADTWFEDQVIKVVEQNPGYHTYIFSGESAFHRMDAFFASFRKATARGMHITVLLSVRNPFDMLESEYQQLIKRHGLTSSIDDFLASRSYRCIHTEKSSRLISRMLEHEVPFKIFNYTSLGRDISFALAEQIGIASLFPLDCIANKEINRSLSAAELQFVIYANQFFGEKVGSQLSTALVEQMPLIKRDAVLISSTSVGLIKEMMAKSVNSLNNYLAPDRQLQLIYSTASAVHVAGGLSEEQAKICKPILQSSQVLP